MTQSRAVDAARGHLLVSRRAWTLSGWGVGRLWVKGGARSHHVKHREEERGAEISESEVWLHRWALCPKAAIPKGLTRLLAG